MLPDSKCKYERTNVFMNFCRPFSRVKLFDKIRIRFEVESFSLFYEESPFNEIYILINETKMEI